MRIVSGFAAAAAALLCVSAAAPVLAQASLAPAPPPAQDPRQDRLEGREKYNRAAIGAVGGLAAYHTVYQVGAAARDVVDVIPKNAELPLFGSHMSKAPVVGSSLAKLNVPLLPTGSAPFIGKVPIFGSTVAKVNIPTHLGSAPFVGGVIKDIPVVGPVIAGPPNPILVGAVAIDTYVLPKYAPCGWTESAIFTNTDFNSEPYLRQYVNYLAPLPYTHPPIYAPGPLSPGINAPPAVETIVPASAQASPYRGTVQLEF